MNVILANPRGFCAGVDRAIAIVEKALEKHGAPIYVKNEVVHNKFVVENLRNKGAIFVNDLAQVPKDSIIIFSAHGVSKQVQMQADAISNTIYDATCPLVTKVHKEVARKAKVGDQVILIGHKGHPEVEGTLGQAKNVLLVESIADIDALEVHDNLSYTTQTTLSVDDTAEIVHALTEKYPEINAPKKADICYATQNRQNAVKEIMQDSDILLVLGSSNSSNSNRLREIAEKMGKPGYLIDNAEMIQSSWLEGVTTVGITAGASAPEVLVNEVVKMLGPTQIKEYGEVREDVNFAVPTALR